MKTVDALVRDMYTVLDRGTVASSEDIQRFGQDLAEIVSERLQGKPREPTLRLSNVGKPCKRQLWYKLTGHVGEPIQPHTKLKFLFGDILEVLLLFLAEQAGHTVEHRQKSVVLEGVRGHIDAVIDGVLVDVKSASTRGFTKFTEGDLGDDPFGYRTQLGGYAAALGVERRGWLAVDKQHGHLVFCEDTGGATSAAADIIRTKAAVNSPTPPERGYEPVPDGKSGNMKLPVACSYCPFKRDCHPGLRTFIYASGPVFLTTVKNLPRVTEAHYDS